METRPPQRYASVWASSTIGVPAAFARSQSIAVASCSKVNGWSFSLQFASGDYLRRKHNILICGPAGTGKSHLAQALSHEACRQGFDVLFVSTHKMLTHLHGGRADGTFDRRLATYVRPDLLVLDDFGLKPLSAPAPSDLYDVIHERYEVGSILVTSNRAPAEWPDLFGDPLLASAGLDRLAHHAETLILTGRSYRTQRTTEAKGGATTPP